jgi:hypothetical protein
MSIAQNIELIRKGIPEEVKLVCVSKFNPVSSILEAYETGERIFGESKVQELVEKYEQCPKDIEWHFIGHLQTNKVKYLVSFVDLIHGVDSEKLLNEINKQAQKANRKVNCLIQIHIATEDSKFGFDKSELSLLFVENLDQKYPFINFCGLMGMATFTNDIDLVKQEFAHLNQLFLEIKSLNYSYLSDFNILSSGMSDDFPIAIEYGSTMVRIGSKIFGVRNY